MTNPWLPKDAHDLDHSCEEVETVCPVRVSIGGGGTDVLSYASRYGSSIVSLAIDRYIGLRMTRSGRPSSSIRWSADPGCTASAHPLALISRVLEIADPDCRYDVELSSDQNFGSGLGTSSSLVVSVLLALETFHGMELTTSVRAANAFLLERVLLGEAGGFQDHLASAFGGFNHYRFSSLTSLLVEPVPGEPDPIVNALLLCDSDITRSSSEVLAGQLQRVAAHQEDTIRYLHQIRSLVDETLAAIAAGDIEWLATCVDAGWEIKRNLEPGVSGAQLDSLIHLGKAAGALAARVLGAGAGGHVLFVVPHGQRDDVVRSLRAQGRRPFTVDVAPVGAHVRYSGSSIQVRALASV